MLNFLRNRSRDRGDTAPVHEHPPVEIVVGDAPPFPFSTHLIDHNGIPILDWAAVEQWVAGIADTDAQEQAWALCDRAWLLHVREALGPEFHLAESEGAALVSSLPAKQARRTLEYMELTVERILGTLEGPAVPSTASKALLIVFDDIDSYYSYVAYYYRTGGEFALSSGMHINAGCSHFVTVKDDLTSIEPIIAHEMTHSCLTHLPLPRWLDEGIAVTMENAFAGPATQVGITREMWEEHAEFWDPDAIQEFWSGHSFLRPDEANRLSYELASFIVGQFIRNREPFNAFVTEAHAADAGAAAAQEQLGIDLGEFVCVLLEQDDPDAWAPSPEQWAG